MPRKTFLNGAIEVIPTYHIQGYKAEKHISIAAMGNLTEKELKTFVTELEKAVVYFKSVK